MEHLGSYWGPPADDQTAIEACERLRRDGATFIAFAKPSFWWLDYYAGFHRHLRTTYPCVHVSDLVLAFDLRPADYRRIIGTD